MTKKNALWKKGRGKLGILAPLLGTWKSEADSPMGKLKCMLTFEPFGSNYIQLKAHWEHPKFVYEELALYGVLNGKVRFWSFTTDGKQSHGSLSDGRDVHPEAIAFEAKMPAGLARMIYWPREDGGFNWAVESKNKKGWRRFTEHMYSPA